LGSCQDIKEIEEILQLIPPPIPTNAIENNSENKEARKIIEESAIDIENPKNANKEKRYVSNLFLLTAYQTEYGLANHICASFLNHKCDIGIKSDAAIIVLAYIPGLWFLWAQELKVP